MNKWPMVRIADEFNLQMGKTPERDNPAYWGGDQNWAAIADIARSGMYLSKTKETISQAAVDESGIKEVPPDTIVMSFKLSIGRTAITTSRIYTNEAVMAFLPHDAGAFDLHFLYHLFANRDWSEGSNKAVKGMTLNKATLKAARIPKPDILEQRTIAAILDKLCGLIEKCDEQLERLNQFVKSRFVEMFGDVGRTPNHWPIVSFDDVAEIESGLTTDFMRYSDCPHIGIDSIEKDTGALKGYRTVAEDKLTSGKYYFTDRHIIYSKIRPNLNKVALPTFEGLCSADAYAILPKEGTDRVFFAFVIRSKRFLDYILPLSGRSGMPKVNQTQVRGFCFPLPPLALQREFAAFVARVDKLAFAVRQRRDLARKMYRAKIQEYFG